MKNIVELEFATLTFYENYVVSVINEGVNIEEKENEILMQTSNNYFSHSFVYITHRINSYSVNPQVYQEVSQFDKLIGFAVVSKDYLAKSNAKIERLFLDKPFEIFSLLEDAINWSQNLLKPNQAEPSDID